jgi:carbon storage regulator CsrA
LPLSRKAGEAIQIDGPALVEVRRIGRSRVTLLVHAAEETNVVRKELTVLTPEKS